MDSKKKCSLLMSCHQIINSEDNLPFETGVYGGGSLVVVSEQECNPLMLNSEVRDLLWDKEVDEAFVYLAGLSFVSSIKKDSKFETTMAFLKIAMGHTGKEKIHLVGCSCNWGKKNILAEEMGLNLIQSECGGSDALGKIAADVLGKNTV